MLLSVGFILFQSGIRVPVHNTGATSVRWVVLLLVVVGMRTIAALCLWRVNPEVVVARISFHKGTKLWDKILLTFLSLAIALSTIVAVRDDVHFHWLPVPWWVCGLGYVLLLFGFIGMTWAEAVNKFFERTVRIQTDREQTVIDTGPYDIVRHPGYSSGLLILVGIPLTLGSIWALIPASLSWLLLVLRTQWEDETLQAELPRYKEYAERVRYKLIPGVW
jgi:protein-S-isoprenylcysteine O-methyltransferase Ste14